jgi:hypothetical protein
LVVLKTSELEKNERKKNLDIAKNHIIEDRNAIATPGDELQKADEDFEFETINYDAIMRLKNIGKYFAR